MLPSFSAVPRRAAVVAVAALAIVAPARGAAQTDYYNTDAGRPLQVEDAYAIERRAVEIQAAPLRLERSHRGVYSWGVEPEVAIGLLPRTQVEIGVPLALIDAGVGGWFAGVAGVDASVLHTLNVETRLPAFALGASVLAPVGSLATDAAYASVKGIATRTFPWARFHLNAQYTFGEVPPHPHGPAADAVGAGAAELSRWLGGVAVDRALPLQSLLLSAEVYARQPMDDHEPLEWNVAAGTRVQIAPRLAVDVGGGARVTGEDKGWFLTTGGAWTVGLPWRARR